MAELQSVRRGPKAVKIELDKERALLYDMNAFGELESIYGSVEAAMNSLQGAAMKNLKVILWAGLAHEEIAEADPITGEPLKYNITPYQVGKLIAPDMIPALMEKVTEAMNIDMPKIDTAQQQETSTTKAPALPAGVQMATVELTPEEKKALEEQEAKNV